MAETAIDWSTRPAPWNLIGPAFRAEVEAILGRRKAPPAKLPDRATVEFNARLVRAKITQAELARRVGCSDSSINRITAGRDGVSAELWSRVDAALTAAETNGGRPA